MMRWLLLVVFALSSATAFAQPMPDRAAHRREKIKERIRALRAYTLTAELQLDEQTAAKLFPVLKKYDDEFDKLLQQRIDVQRRLDAAGTLKDAKEIDKLIDEAVANQRALWDTEDKRLAQLRKILTPAQTARVLVVLPAMERKIQNQIRKAVQRPKAQRQGQPVDPFEGELGGNPFSDEPAPPMPRQKKQPANQKPCDPFGSMVGCQ
ncbi:MAG TPA: hypothetical protein VIV11_35515 [Kofleriaceae bacterium]